MENYEKLVKLAEHKEYRVVVKKEFKYLVDKAISDGAKLCWLHIKFEGYFSQGKLLLSNSELGRQLKKSASTISRYLSELAGQGFIKLVVQNCNDTPSQRIIYVSFPSEGISKIETSPNRRAKKYDGSISKMRRGHLNNEVSTNYNTNYTAEGNSRASNTKLYNSQISEDTDKVNMLSTVIADLHKKFITAKSREKYEITRRIGEVEGEIQRTRHRIKSLSSKLVSEEKIAFLSDKLKCENTFVNNIPGERRLSNFQLEKLKKSISTKVPKDKINTMLNDLVFNIRFGKLSKESYITREKMCVDFSVNIGVKLIQSGRYNFMCTEELYIQLGSVNQSIGSLSIEGSRCIN